VTCFNEFAEEFMDFASPGENFFETDGPLGKCLEEIKQSDVELNLYNTTENAKDVRAVVSALGYSEYNVYGISYGTKLAQEVMRSAPEQVRSVVLDSISRVDAPAYDSNGVPLDQSLGWVVDLCAEDTECAEAYPDLEGTINALAERLKTEQMTILGEERDETFINEIVEAGNKYLRGPYMAYLPRAFADLAEGKTATVETLLSGGFATKPLTPEALTSTHPDLSAADKAMAEALVMQANQMNLTAQSAQKLLAALADDLSVAGSATTEQVLDDELSTMLTAMETDDVLALTRDYVRLGSMQPDKDDILTFVEVHVPPAFRARIRSLVEAMTEEDVAAFYRRASLDGSRITNNARMQLSLTIYACQEDFPFNSRDGFETYAGQYRFAFLDKGVRADTYELYAFCDLFDKYPREGFHEPVVSDIPVLATGGMKDTQTNPSAAEAVSRTLGNAQHYLYPETGHGAIAFSKCARDMAHAFIEDPLTKVNDSCIEEMQPKFLLPDGSFSGG
jgi:pimeloyl-ACP methyl ester carboxylesterase